MSMTAPAPMPSLAIGPTALALGALGDWPLALEDLLRREAAVVRVVVATVRGSAPREPGASMLVTPSQLLGSIGGGHLEWQALAAARELLDSAAPASPVRLQRFILGRELGQCCGGAVELWLQRHGAADRVWLRSVGAALRRHQSLRLRSCCGAAGVTQHWQLDDGAAAVELRRCGEEIELIEPLAAGAPLWLYGAGHVGQALVRIVADLPLRLSWVDSRSQLFPAALPANARALAGVEPVASVAAAPAQARFVVMTHDHELDYQLCAAILRRGDFAFAGLIGSQSKAARFRSRLARDGFDAATIARLVCPLGLGQTRSKWPGAIAVSVAAQLLQTLAPPAPRRSAALAVADDCAVQAGGSCGGCRRSATP